MPRLELKPTLSEAIAVADLGNLIPVYAEVASDLDTPVSLFLKLAADEPSFLLESVDGGERIARYSFLGVRLREALVLRGRDLKRHTLIDGELQIQDWKPPLEAIGQPCADVLDQLRVEMSRYKLVPTPDLPRFCGGLVGYTGYDVVRQFEQLPATAIDILGVPDAVYMLADTLIAFDHARHRLLIIANARVESVGDLTHDRVAAVTSAYDDAAARIKTIAARLQNAIRELRADPTAECTATSSNKSQAEFERMVAVAKEHVFAGDTFQIQLSRRLTRRTTAHPFSIYRQLRRINPSPWMIYFNFGALVPQTGPASQRTAAPMRIIAASPELHARFEDGRATVRPIAGTRRRGRTPEEDAAMARELINDPKERAEHVMLVDLGRNDIGRIAKYGTVTVPDLMVIENYSHVMHIVSSVEGEVRDGLDMFDVLRATFPAGTLSGAPKVRTMQLIEELEGERRGIYGGAAGYFSFGKQMDTCIIIRTILMIGDTCYLQAAGGVVADSVPALEYKETANKLRACVLAIDEAELQ